MEFITSSFRTILFLSILPLLSACDSGQMAPVEELKPQYAMNHRATSYLVKPGDTLYAIAFLYDQNVNQLAKFNHLSYPYYLKSGQSIQLLKSNNAYVETSIVEKYKPKWYRRNQFGWIWPTKGRLAPRNYNNPIELKGITIIGHPHEKVLASANGVVAYAGNGLPGYGNLILIKHPNDFLTAYAFNSTLLVREGQNVRAGEQIASMGQLDSGQWGLHFEIRNKGHAVNPLQFLASRN